MFFSQQLTKIPKYIQHINTCLSRISVSLTGKWCFNGLLPVKILITWIHAWCTIFHLLLLLKRPNSPMRTMLLISDYICVHNCCWKKVDFLIMLCYFKSSHYCCAIFWIPYSFLERGHYLHCGCLPQTWIHRALRQEWKEGNEGKDEGC